MSADWILHALPNSPETREKLRFLEGADGTFYSSEDLDENYVQGIDGYWRWSAMPEDRWLTSDQSDKLRKELNLDGDDCIWLGQVSYLKAGLFSMLEPPDPTNWIPEPGQAVVEIATRLPEITPTLITSVMVAMNVKDTSWFRPSQVYTGQDGIPRRHGGTNKEYVGMQRPRRVKRWLEAHQGKLLNVEVW